MTYVLSTAWILPGKTDRLRAWYRELESRKDESLETLKNEGVRQEVAFILNTEHGDLLCVFLEVGDMDSANAAFFSSPHKIDEEHRRVMDEVTAGGSTGRVYAEMQYALMNPGERDESSGDA